MLTIDGSVGEGGGQALRTSLALSLVTGVPFRIENIRARRARPGLMRQHLTAVQAAAAVGRAKVHGAEVGSRVLDFEPTQLVGGEHRFSVGTAGSATLVLQTVLPALLRCSSQSTVIVEGGTHNPMAPPFEFLDRVYLPILRRMGAHITATLERPGFYPAGGGRVRVDISPFDGFRRLDLRERGARVSYGAKALFAALPFDIAHRELAVVRDRLGWGDDHCQPVELTNTAGPGNVLEIELEFEQTTELFTGFGQRGVTAETVANQVLSEVEEYLAAEVPVGQHLADQLLLPFALAGGGSFSSLPASHHFDTQCEVLQRFLHCQVVRTQQTSQSWLFEVRR
jgi:RNA 3'-terminal phosphate cyclase (ATP)